MGATAKPMAEISLLAARLAIAAGVAVILLLASLHVLSPEFDPSWRMVSEYANGQYGWVLSLMFLSWAVSSWALAFAVWSHVKTTGGRIGLVFLVAAGVGEAMASVFDINHNLHGLAGIIGIGSLPIAAMLISVSLGRTQVWSVAKKALLWTANLTWMSVVLLAATFAILIVTYTRAGGETFNQELSKYIAGKGTLKFPLDKPLPLKLIGEIVKYQVADNLKKAEMKSRKIADLKRAPGHG